MHKTTGAPSWSVWLSDRMAAVGFETSSDLARAARIPDSVISRWRSGSTQPSLAQLRRLQRALQAPLVELLVVSGHLTPDEAGLQAPSQPTRVLKDVKDAIRHDPDLPDDLRHLLELQYDAMRAVAAARAQEARASTG
ncbi:MAG: helix-turn-helix domain-containing protein [Actinomycetes bacterium]